MPTKRLVSCLAVLALSAAFACGDDTDPPQVVTGGSSGTPTSSTSASGGNGGGGGGVGGEAPECPAPEPAHPGEMTNMDSVQALLIDQTGAPAENVQTSICGVNVCSELVQSDAQGQVNVDGAGLEYHDASFNTGYDGRGYAKMAAPIPMAPTYDFGTVRVFKLDALNTGVALMPGADATHGGVTLSVPADGVVEFDSLTFPDEPDQRFVATVVDITAFDPAEMPHVDASLNLEVIIGMGADGTHICPAAKMTFDNAAGWAAGTQVEIFINGTKTFKHYAPYTRWAKVADAVVDADGMTVTTVDGQGIEVLGTYGARPM